MTTKSIDLYQTLGIKRDATADQIKQAFRNKAKKHHPDRNPGDKKASERFQAITLAYKILSDPERRRRYDDTGDTTDMPDNRVSKLVSTLSQVFCVVLTTLMEKRLDLKQQDMPALLRDYCDHHLAELASRRDVLARAKLDIVSLTGRFSTKQGDNYMEEVVAFEVTKLDRELTKLAEVETNIKNVLEWLKGCSYKKDPDPLAQLRNRIFNGQAVTFKMMFTSGG